MVQESSQRLRSKPYIVLRVCGVVTPLMCFSVLRHESSLERTCSRWSSSTFRQACVRDVFCHNRQ